MRRNDLLRAEISNLKKEISMLKDQLTHARQNKIKSKDRAEWRERLREAINNPAPKVMVENDDVYIALSTITKLERKVAALERRR